MSSKGIYTATRGKRTCAEPPVPQTPLRDYISYPSAEIGHHQYPASSITQKTKYSIPRQEEVDAYGAPALLNSGGWSKHNRVQDVIVVVRVQDGDRRRRRYGATQFIKRRHQVSFLFAITLFRCMMAWSRQIIFDTRVQKPKRSTPWFLYSTSGT